MNGPLPGLLAPLTIPASWVYGGAVTLRNRRFDRGRGVRRLDLPVVSVGNVTVGGTGKSPFVRWLARRLLADGRRPVILMRGYRARADRPADEVLEHRDLLPEVDVVAAPDRAAALDAYRRAHAPDCVLLDDGFQHRQIHRDLDLVLVDASRPGLDGRLLPAGFLREPSDALGRADAVIVTRADAVDPALERTIERCHGRAPVASTVVSWTGLRVFEGGAEAERPVDWLAGQRVATMLGVGNPGGVRAQVRAAGAEIASDIPARDHEHYTAAKLERLRQAAEAADATLVTGKDWVKVREVLDLTRWPGPIVVPRPEVRFLSGEPALLELVHARLAGDPGRTQDGS